MKKILVISWFFPPINSSEGNVTYKLLKNSKFEYDVFTQNKSNLFSYKQSELPQSKNINTIFSESGNFNEWKSEAIKYFEKNKSKYDIVMTRSMPPESHEVGLAIKNIKPEIKWYASFGDPIAKNPYSEIDKPDLPFSINWSGGIRKIISPIRILRNWKWKFTVQRNFKKNEEQKVVLQNNILKNADKIILNNKYQTEYMLKDFNDYKEKVLILNHSYDSKLYPNVKHKEEKLIFSFVGRCDNIRSPKILFQAIERLKKLDQNLENIVEFNFYGELSDDDKLFVINHELWDLIKIKGSIDYLTSLKIMNNSDYLIQIDGNISEISEENIFFAAKIVDYIGTGNQIFAITMDSGASYDILKQYNAVICTYSDDDVFNNLYYIIVLNRHKKINKEFASTFDAKNVACCFEKECKNTK